MERHGAESDLLQMSAQVLHVFLSHILKAKRALGGRRAGIQWPAHVQYMEHCMVDPHLVALERGCPGTDLEGTKIGPEVAEKVVPITGYVSYYDWLLVPMA